MTQKSIKSINVFSIVFLLFFLFGSFLSKPVLSAPGCMLSNQCTGSVYCETTGCSACPSGQLCCDFCPSSTPIPEATEAPPICPGPCDFGLPGDNDVVPCGETTYLNCGNDWGSLPRSQCNENQRLVLECSESGDYDAYCTADPDPECVDPDPGNPTSTPVPTAVPTAGGLTPLPTSPVTANIKCNITVSTLNGLTQAGTYPFKSYIAQSGQDYSNAITLTSQKDGVGAPLNLEAWRAPYGRNCWYGYNYSTVPAECPTDIKTETAFSNKLQNGIYTLLTDFKTADQQNVTTGSYDLVCNAKDAVTNNLCSGNPYITPGAGNIQSCGDNGRVVVHVIGPPLTPACEKKIQGDANCDGLVDATDYIIWAEEFNKIRDTKTASFNLDMRVDLIDYEIWRVNMNSATISGGPLDPRDKPPQITLGATENPRVTGAILPVSIVPDPTLSSGRIGPSPTATQLIKPSIKPSNMILPVSTTSPDVQ